jgi:hypothetical protein
MKRLDIYVWRLDLMAEQANYVIVLLDILKNIL